MLFKHFKHIVKRQVDDVPFSVVLTSCASLSSSFSTSPETAIQLVGASQLNAVRPKEQDSLPSDMSTIVADPQTTLNIELHDLHCSKKLKTNSDTCNRESKKGNPITVNDTCFLAGIQLRTAEKQGTCVTGGVETFLLYGNLSQATSPRP